MVMEEVMADWRDHRRGADTSSYSAGSGGPVSIPLGPGEWDEGLGIPMCVVCQGVRSLSSRHFFSLHLGELHLRVLSLTVGFLL